jgi:hypothetical protein
VMLVPSPGIARRHVLRRDQGHQRRQCPATRACGAAPSTTARPLTRRLARHATKWPCRRAVDTGMSFGGEPDERGLAPSGALALRTPRT